MNREDIIRMAKEAHKDLVTVDYPGHAGQLDPWTLRLLERFAALVAAAEREECAKVCDAYAESHGCSSRGSAALDLADTIRKRGEVKP